MDHRPSVELLRTTHTFPGPYPMRVIGAADDDFVGRVLEAARGDLDEGVEIPFTRRHSSGGRHVAVSLSLPAESPEHVRAVYARILELRGVTLVF